MDTTDTKSGEYEGGHKAIAVRDITDAEFKQECAKHDAYVAAHPPAPAAQYHTTTQLQGMVALKTGKPCNSRNRPALLKKLGMPVPVEAAEHAKNWRKTAAPMKDVAKGGKKVAALAKKIAKSKGEKPRTGKVKLTKPKAIKVNVTATVRGGVDLRAIALRAVTSAMARKSPPSLRVLCAELEERGVKTPRGLKKWMPSSVQSLMRQAKAGK